jgi:hypothetical protein
MAVMGFGAAAQTPQIDTRRLNPAISDAVMQAAMRSVQLKYTPISRNIRATFVRDVAVKGPIVIKKVEWQCAGNTCTATTTSVPQVALCKAVAAVLGQRVRSFGDQRVPLDEAQLRECNGGAPASVEITEPQQPGERGPNGNFQNVIEQFFDQIAVADRDIDVAFGWSPDIWQDGAEPRVWYYLPREYRLQLQRGERPLAIGFTDTLESAENPDKTVVMTATLAPPAADGDLTLLTALARSTMRVEGSDDIELRPFPVDGLEVDVSGLIAGLGIAPEDVVVTSRPQSIRDPLSVRIRMTEVAKTEFLSLLRGEGGGAVVRLPFGEGRSALVPVYFSLNNVSGYPLPSLSVLATTPMIGNASFVPVTLKGVVGYVNAGSRLERRYRPLPNVPTLGPNQQQQLTAAVARELAQPFGTANVVHSWFDFEPSVDCNECIETVVRMAESQVDLLRRADLKLEMPASVFSSVGLFKVGVQVRSRFFDSSGRVEEVRDYELRPSAELVTDEVFLERTLSADDPIGEYRVRGFRESGTTDPWSVWRPLERSGLTLLAPAFGTSP